MSRDTVYLLDILQSARLAVAYLSGWTQERFLGSTEKQDSVVRRLVIIGEAARRVSSQTRSQLAGIAWEKMTAMRNFVVHEYDDVDMAIVWDTVQHDLPDLIAAIKHLVPPEDAE